MFGEEFVPALEVVEGGVFGEIVDEDGAVGVLEVGGDETAVAFLSGSVPHLQAVGVGVAGEIADVEVDSHRGLRGGGSTVWASSKRLVV